MMGAGLLVGEGWPCLREYLRESEEGEEGGAGGQGANGQEVDFASLFEGVNLKEGERPPLLPVTLLR